MSIAPPSGMPPPRYALLGATRVDLERVAERICERYRGLYPDEQDRYGDAGMAWCLHDNQHILNWAVGSVTGLIDLPRELTWLADVLHARQFPLDRLAHDLELAAEELENAAGSLAAPAAAALRDGAAMVRQR